MAVRGQSVQPRDQEVGRARAAEIFHDHRATAREKENHVEVVDVVDKIRNQDGRRDKQNIRHHDFSKPGKGGRTVYLRAFKQLRRNILQHARREQHGKRHAYPHVHDNDGNPRKQRIAKKRYRPRRKPEAHQEQVDNAVALQHTRNRRQRDKGRNSDGQHKHRPKKRLAPHLLLVNQHGQEDPAEVAGNRRENRPNKRPAQHPEKRGAELGA